MSGIVMIAVWPTAHFPGADVDPDRLGGHNGGGRGGGCRSLGGRVTRDWLLAAAGVVLLRFAVLGIGASDCGEFAIAAGSGAGALIFAALFLARTLQVRGTSGAAAGSRLQLFAR